MLTQFVVGREFAEAEVGEHPVEDRDIGVGRRLQLEVGAVDADIEDGFAALDGNLCVVAKVLAGTHGRRSEAGPGADAQVFGDLCEEFS